MKLESSPQIYFHLLMEDIPLVFLKLVSKRELKLNNKKLILTCVSAITICLLAFNANCQTLQSVDISAFGKDRQIDAMVTNISVSECKNASAKDAATYHDLSYDIHVAADVIFKNRLGEAVMLYRNFDPAMTERVAMSEEDIASGKYLTGFDKDRMAISRQPTDVSIDDFVAIKPGATYMAKINATVFALRDKKKELHAPGKYWIQLGIDSRPDKFYFDAGAEKDFKHKWHVQNHFAEFILTKPFLIEIEFNPNAPSCDP